MIVPKYQWLIENKAQSCGGFCDSLYISNEFVPKFQVSFTPEVLLDEDFDDDENGAPIDMVGLSSDTYIFDASYNPASGQDWVHTFTFLEQGIERCYIICLTNDFVPVTGRKTEYGYFTLIEVPNGVSYKSRIASGINTNFPEPITATVNGDNIEITGLPAGTQIVAGDNYPAVSGAGTGQWSWNNFFPVNDKACLFNISKFAEIDEPTTTPSITTQVVIDALNTVTIHINFTNDLGFDVDMDIIVQDNSFGTIETISKVAKQGTNSLVFSFTAGVSPPIYYNIVFQLSDTAVYSESIYNEIVGFCFNTIKIEQLGYVSGIDVTDCDGNTTSLGIEGWIYNHNGEYNYLITLAEEIGDIFQLTIHGSDGDSWTSKYYEIIDPGTCDKGSLYKLEWSDTCKFAGIDYANLDTTFTNELLLNGVMIKQGLDKIEAISTITSTGQKKPVYRHTIEQYEIRFHPYTAETQSTLERAFEHSIIKINDESYYVGDGASYQVSELDNFIYTGRIDLYLSGSEVIKSSCCC